MPAPAQNTISGPRKAAIFLAALGEEAAGLVLRHLNERDVEAVSGELATLEAVEADALNRVLIEVAEASEHAPSVVAGAQYLQKVLRRAFNEGECARILQRIEAMNAPLPMEILKSADPQLLLATLAEEHPQAIALILAQLEASQASAVLTSLPQEKGADVLKRLAQLKQFSPESARTVSEVVQARLQTLGERRQRSLPGLKNAAEIMNRMPVKAAAPLLEAVEKEQPTLAIGIRNLMFTFEDLITVPDVSIREWLGAVEKKTLAMALKGASEEVQNHIMKGMSSRAAQMLKEDMEALGPVRGKEIAKAQEETIAVARQLEAEGRLVLRPEGDDEYIV